MTRHEEASNLSSSCLPLHVSPFLPFLLSPTSCLTSNSLRTSARERKADSTTWSTRCWKITQLQYIHAFLFREEEEKNIWLEYLMLFATACCMPCKAFLIQSKWRQCLQDNENQRLYWVKFPFRFTLFVSERVERICSVHILWHQIDLQVDSTTDFHA